MQENEQKLQIEEKLDHSKDGADPVQVFEHVKAVNKVMAKGFKNKQDRAFEAVFNLMLDSIEPNTGMSYRELVTSALVGKAMEGDVRAFEAIRDTVGEKPTDKVEGETTLVIKAGGAEEWSV